MNKRMTPAQARAQEQFGEESLSDALIRLFNVERKTYDEVAQMLGISKATLGYWLLKENTRIVRVAVRMGQEVTVQMTQEGVRIVQPGASS